MMHITIKGDDESDAEVLERNLGYIKAILIKQKRRIKEIEGQVILEANEIWPRRAMTRVSSVKETEN